MSTGRLEVPALSYRSFGRWLAARLVDRALALCAPVGGTAWEEWRQRW